MQKPGHIHFLGAALLSAVMLTISWQPYGIILTVFAGFVPLLWIERNIREQQRSSGWVMLYAYLTFVLWNVSTTWWIWNASPEGAMMAFVLNSLLMCLPFMLYHFLTFRMHEKDAGRIFILLWTAFEYAHFNWEGTWPWLTLGNVFSSIPGMVQWYEYTGVGGGTLWVLFVNMRLYRFLLEWNERSVMMRFSKGLNLVFFTLFAPVFFSWYIGNEVKVSGKNLNVVVVQPNIDPYHDKFGGIAPEEQTKRMLALAEKEIDSTTHLVCFPETAIVGSLNEADMEHNPNLLLVRQFLQAHPQLSILTGADTYRFYPDKANISTTARPYREDLYYDAYNTALFIDQSRDIQIYHKSVLVPGVERLPYANSIGFIQKLTIDLGGTSGSLGCDSTSRTFILKQDGVKRASLAPVICYESVFGEYLGTYIQKGADLICIITNDGWWGNTAGYKQHFDYARLRAIESRRFVARSANTGISGFIDPKGNIISHSAWWTEDALKATVTLNTGETFYTQHGDYLGKITLFLSGFYLLINLRRKRTA